MERMLVFCGIGKCVFSYMPKQLFIVLVNLQMTICQLSPFLTAHLPFSIFLFFSTHTKYFLSNKVFLSHNHPCHSSGNTNLGVEPDDL